MSHAEPVIPHHHTPNGQMPSHPMHPNMGHMNGQMMHHHAQNYAVHFPAERYRRPEYV